jgi:hypothetical protein
MFWRGVATGLARKCDAWRVEAERRAAAIVASAGDEAECTGRSVEDLLRA